MSVHADNIRRLLGSGLRNAAYLSESLGISQPTVSRTLGTLSREVVRVGSGPSIQYALRDIARGVEDVPIYRVSKDGELKCLGHLIAVCPGPTGMVFQQCDGVTAFYDDLPWWLDDMRPQGFLGRAYARAHGRSLGLPDDLKEWSGTHTLRALLAHGHECIGNLLLGDFARERWLTLPSPVPVEPHEFPRLAEAATLNGDPGSSAGGEQPKFVAYVDTPAGARHAIVKFAGTKNEVQRRWADLLVAEHLALETLRENEHPAASTWVMDEGGYRFLVSERFDREGDRGRRALISLTAMDAEFVGMGGGPWPEVARRLREDRRIGGDAEIQLLWAFGMMIGNTDMHFGNLSFISERGLPYQVAPAYDMLPMVFAPLRDGTLSLELPRVRLLPCVPAGIWRRAHSLACGYVDRLHRDERLGAGFSDCIAALDANLADAEEMLGKLD